MTTEVDLRWQCLCGRFVAASTIREEDHLDPFGSYYGITTTMTADCSRCGTVEHLRLTAVREAT